ncbi:natural product precursor [Aquimarina amphilecti]|uniref:Natural product n=1 Tax=Aquimarina amphilecti TaxID=1038014 RepID=A0A1H7VEP1_AQUAM|nr:MULTISPECIES: TIGR04149 family rSAM-modified RiPP [Aquimarina]MBQ4805205.1 TIGR04149 family rSAM-modified RiPP [Aquimarina sp. MMG015]SEM07385.1 natural product precursor [Aquimarina amphilecti]
MKTKQENKISFKKLTIAKINLHSMTKIKGGDCDPIKPDTDSHHTMCGCDNIL